MSRSAPRCPECLSVAPRLNLLPVSFPPLLLCTLPPGRCNTMSAPGSLQDVIGAMTGFLEGQREGVLADHDMLLRMALSQLLLWLMRTKSDEVRGRAPTPLTRLPNMCLSARSAAATSEA